jgi:Rod binding domain-containing protein
MKVQSAISAASAGTPGGDGRNLKKLEKAARDFESILIGQIFELMNSTVGDEGVIEKSFPRKMFEEMIQGEFAKEFSGQGGLNLQKVLVERFNSGENHCVDTNHSLSKIGDSKFMKKPGEGFRGQAARFSPLQQKMNSGKIIGKELMPLKYDGKKTQNEQKR